MNSTGLNQPDEIVDIPEPIQAEVAEGQGDLGLDKSTATDPPMSNEMKRLGHHGLDPSCDCWCCNTDLSCWCLIISILRIIILIVLEVCLYISYLASEKPEGESAPKKLANQVPSNLTRRIDVKQPSLVNQSGEGLPLPELRSPRNMHNQKIPLNAMVTDTAGDDYYFMNMICVAVFSVLGSYCLFIGAASKKPGALALVPAFTVGMIAAIIWVIVLESNLSFVALFMMFVIFDIYVIFCAFCLIIHIKKGYYDITKETIPNPNDPDLPNMDTIFTQENLEVESETDFHHVARRKDDAATVSGSSHGDTRSSIASTIELKHQGQDIIHSVAKTPAEDYSPKNKKTKKRNS